MVKDTTLYERIGVNSSASQEEIQTAYRKKSKLVHPDRFTDENERKEATIKFQELGQAKDILLNEDKRRMYDQLGMDIFKNRMDQDDDISEMNPNDFFSNIFSSMNGFPGFKQKQEEEEDIICRLDVTLEQIYNAQTVNHIYKYKSKCSKCSGTGSNDGKLNKCSKCNGNGSVNVIRQMGPMIMKQEIHCSICQGKGKIVDKQNSCSICSGNGYIEKERSISVPLNSGLSQGDKISLDGKGHHLKYKSKLILVINELPHNIFKRVQDNLIIIIELKLYQALFGFEKTINFLDGRKLLISSKSRTEHRTIRRIPNYGMKSIHSNTTGDLLIQFIIKMPNLDSMPSETKNQIKSLIQSFDKKEALDEQQISKDNSLVKTIMEDINERDADAVNHLLLTMKLRS